MDRMNYLIGGFNFQVQLMLTGVLTKFYEREKQPGVPDGEIAPPGSPNLAACPNGFSLKG
jgi:hypothetical protein